MDVSAVAQAAPEWVRAHTPGWLAAAPSWVSAHTPDLPPRGAYRWERERGAHLENRSRPGTSRRRRAQVLARAAHRGQRTGLGVGESQVGDDLVPSWWRRAIAEQDAGESLARALAVAVIVMAAAVTVGPGVGAGYGGYRLLTRYAPRIGRLWVWPWLIGGVSVGLVLWFLGCLTGPRLALVPRLPVLWTSLSSTQLVISWVCWQAVIALVAVGYYVWAWGWRAVPRGAVTPSKQLADGTWRETPEAEKVDIGFRADDYDPYVPPAVEDDGYHWPDEDWADDKEFPKGEKS